MARLPRLVVPRQPHLVLQRALPGWPAFVDGSDRQAYLGALHEALASEQVRLHAYALLTTEVRMLVTPPGPHPMSRAMQGVGRRYVSAYNLRHGHRGTIWEGRFRCAPIERGEPCLEAMVWVDASTDDRAASSALHHVGIGRDALLNDPPEYWALGNTPFERELAYRDRLSAGLSAAREVALRRAAMGSWAFGSASFIDEVAASCGRPAAPRPHGRPRKEP
jgi:putative transposase